MVRKILCVLLVLCALGTACRQASEKQRERDEILAALKKYLDQQSGFEQGTADRAVRGFNTDRDRAEIVVEFKSRTDGRIRLMVYHLRRENQAWIVKDGKPFVPGAS